MNEISPIKAVTAEDFASAAAELSAMRRLLRSWSDLPAGKTRSSINPVHFGADLLPHLTLATVLENGEDVEYDLIGEIMSKVAPRLRRGSLASDALQVDPGNRLILGLLQQCAKSRQPVAFHAVFDSYDGDPRGVLAVLCPLGIDPADTNKAASDMLIGVWRCRRLLALPWESAVDITDIVQSDLIAARQS